jgi:hypothetical protein
MLDRRALLDRGVPTLSAIFAAPVPFNPPFPGQADSVKRLSLAIRLLLAACLLGATFNHVRAIVDCGLLCDYGLAAALPSRLYWTSLTVLDPLAAALLLVRPRAGLLLTLAIIVSDVLHNTYYVASANQWGNPFYLAQVGFLVLVTATAPLAWRGVPRA